MDPNELLKRIRELTAIDRPLGVYEAAELAYLCRALDHWISQGGFLPAVWAPGGVR